MFVELIKKIVSALNDAHVSYMIIGGQAVLLYGYPRLTRDIDITLGIDTDEFSRIQTICQQLRLKILTEKPGEFVKDTKVLPAEDPVTNIRVDFIFSFTPYEQEAIARGNKVTLEGVGVNFAAIEDVIIHKLLAGRPTDDEDIRQIFAKNKSDIDRNYIKKWLDKFGKLETHHSIGQRFDGLIKDFS